MSLNGQPMSRYPYVQDDIVVASPHQRQVLGVLEEANVCVGQVEDSADLDLSRIPLLHAGESAADALDALAPHGPTQAGDPLTRILMALRRHFADRHGGWVPTMGKNRLLGPVSGGGGAVSHGGGGSPKRTRARWKPRVAGPGRGVRVGVFDTALFEHPWLSGGWTGGQSDRLPRPDGPYLEEAGHGTFVTGLVLNQAPGATVQVCCVLPGPPPAGTPSALQPYTASCWEVAKKIVSAGRDLDILNLSLLCYTDDGVPPLVLARAIDRLDPDVVVVAAAGNHGDLHRRPDGPRRYPAGHENLPAYPAALDDVVAVGAADRHGRPMSFTPAGKCWIDLLVFGDDLLSTYLSGPVAPRGGRQRKFSSWARWSGSSFAAALLSGAVAAGTEPGRVSARQSLDEIRRNAGPASVGPNDYTPPFVDLRVT